jgi:biopolymer transport protein ExbB/TolQ
LQFYLFSCAITKYFGARSYYCIGPAAIYPQIFLIALDPVVEAKKEADRIAAEQKAAAEAAAEKARKDKEEQDAIAASVAAAKSKEELWRRRRAAAAKAAEAAEQARKDAEAVQQKAQRKLKSPRRNKFA